MAKAKTRWVCQECGYQSSRFLGRCTDCGGWATLVEEILAEEPASIRGRASSRAASAGPVPLSQVGSLEAVRIKTGIGGLDEVLGGGLVPGAVVLLAGDPGVGKSTLLIKLAEFLVEKGGVLYIAGEESASQVRLRADRLNLKTEGILVDAEQDVSLIEKRLRQADVAVSVVDSIQSLFHPQVPSAPGSVSQVRECAAEILAVAKARDIATILVGHVTKDGSIAGPRVLEHMVDVVLQFEGEKSRQLRVLRAVKNRFGSTAEVAIFSMTERGLIEVDNPSAFFLSERLARLGLKQAPSGTAVIAGGEGSRSLLLEVQALVGTSAYPSPRRVANGFDLNRFVQILAVLEKKVGLSLSRFDAYINITGGFELSDPAGDLGVAVAVATSFLDRSLDPGLILIGEIGLTGEVRPVHSIERRLKEAARMGFQKAIVPYANADCQFDGLAVVGVEFLVEALNLAMPGQNLPETAGSPDRTLAEPARPL